MRYLALVLVLWAAPAGVGVQDPDRVLRLGRTTPAGSTRIERIPIDAYVAQVLAGEGQPKASEAAQQALAITARTFALANRNRHRAEGFDLCDTTHCQVVRPATAMTTRAAQATRGRVLLHQGQPAFVFYSAWCGGQTERASQVWPGAVDYSDERSRDDEACEDEPEWTSELGVADIETALRTAGLRGSRLRGVRVLARNASGRVSRLRVDGFTPAEITGHEFRMAVLGVAGPRAIRSTAFDVDRTRTGYRFRGRGFGHGVGLCVIGAGKRAARGATAAQILRFYFPGLTVGAAGEAGETGEKGEKGEAGEKGAGSADVVVVPTGWESERAVLLSLVRRSRDAIVKLTGVKAAPIRITVHPAVESFGRATGQPWWVPGATSGTSIDLQPLAVLRQQGLLERTVRHAVAHALLDGALAGRPAWVREGAAIYFANATPRAEVPDRVTCPSDRELLRPLSAGAQRDAYARADACFARAIAGGRRWDQIR